MSDVSALPITAAGMTQSVKFSSLIAPHRPSHGNQRSPHCRISRASFAKASLLNERHGDFITNWSECGNKNGCLSHGCDSGGLPFTAGYTLGSSAGLTNGPNVMVTWQYPIPYTKKGRPIRTTRRSLYRAAQFSLLNAEERKWLIDNLLVPQTRMPLLCIDVQPRRGCASIPQKDVDENTIVTQAPGYLREKNLRNLGKRRP